MNEEVKNTSEKLTPMGYLWVLVIISVVCLSGIIFIYHFNKLQDLKAQNADKIELATDEIKQLGAYKTYLIKNGSDNKAEYFTQQ